MLEKPPAVEYLRQSIELNQLSNVTTIGGVLAEEEGVLEFNVFPDGSDVHNSFGAAKRQAEGLQAVNKITVPVTALDAYTHRFGIAEVGIVIIEGAEGRKGC